MPEEGSNIKEFRVDPEPSVYEAGSLKALDRRHGKVENSCCLFVQLTIQVIRKMRCLPNGAGLPGFEFRLHHLLSDPEQAT